MFTDRQADRGMDFLERISTPFALIVFAAALVFIIIPALWKILFLP